MKKSRKEVEEIFNTWWGYLEQSTDYKKLCTSFQKERPALKLLNKFISTWRFFGDVHSSTFSQWWEAKRDVLTKDGRAAWNISETFIQDGHAVIDYINSVQIIRGAKTRKPTAEEFIEAFSTTKFPGYIYLKVSTHGDKKRDELGKEIFKIIREHKKSCHAGECRGIYDDLNTLRLGLNGPAGALKYERIRELKIYLDIYKNGRPDSRKFKFGNDDANYRKINDQYICAKRIIENVERGVFPGEFRPAVTKR